MLQYENIIFYYCVMLLHFFFYLLHFIAWYAMEQFAALHTYSHLFLYSLITPNMTCYCSLQGNWFLHSQSSL